VGKCEILPDPKDSVNADPVKMSGQLIFGHSLVFLPVLISEY
jgi:hypothetical protein